MTITRKFLAATAVALAGLTAASTPAFAGTGTYNLKQLGLGTHASTGNTVYVSTANGGVWK